jgi:hypothetical protein
MSLQNLQAWAKSQINNTAQPEVRPDIGVSVLQLTHELEDLKAYVADLEMKLKMASNQAS